MKSIIYSSFISLGLATSAFSQTEFSLNGLGRALVSNEQLSGNVLDEDTLSSKRGSGGYTLFDLGMNVRTKHFQALSILRVRNEFGLFYGAGASFNFRQITLKGEINDNIRYSAGDIDLKLTPYTVHNIDFQYDKYQSWLFGQRKNIQDYENFIANNKWRLQGAQVTTDYKLGDNQVVGSFSAVRTNPTNELNVADRVFTANRIGYKTDPFEVFINHTGFLDIGIENYDIKFNNQVLTLSGEYSLPFESIPTALTFEGGFSNYSYTDNLADTTAENSDYFYEVHTQTSLVKGVKCIKVGYQDVGPQFVSPGAQTRRINVNSSPLLFASINNNTVARAMGLYDRITGETNFNRSLSITLQDFIPAYGNALPYGKATPNRRGINYSIESDTTIKLLSTSIEGALLSEITPDRVQDGELRKFFVLRGGFDFNLDEVLSTEKAIKLRAGAQSESTSRAGVGPVELSVLTIDAGLSVELFENIHFLAGYKSLSSTGNEYLSQRDQFNGLLSANPTALNYDLTQNIWGLGLRADINSKSQFSANYYSWSIDDKNETESSYTIGQFFLNYTIQF